MNESDLLRKNLACLVASRSSCGNTAGPQGPSGPAGPSGPPGLVVSSFSLINSGGILSPTQTSVANDVTKTVNGWYGAYSDVGYPDATYLNFTVQTSLNSVCVGLTSDPLNSIGNGTGNANPLVVDYGIMLQPDSSFGVHSTSNGNGGNVNINIGPPTSFIYNNTDITNFYIEYDGRYVRYFANGNLLYCQGPIYPGQFTYGNKLYLVVLIRNNTWIDGLGNVAIAPGLVDNLRFGPMGVAGASDTLNWNVNNWGLVISPSMLAKSEYADAASTYNGSFIYSSISYVGPVVLTFTPQQGSFFCGLSTGKGDSASIQFSFQWDSNQVSIYNNSSLVRFAGYADFNSILTIAYDGVNTIKYTGSKPSTPTRPAPPSAHP